MRQAVPNRPFSDDPPRRFSRQCRGHALRAAAFDNFKDFNMQNRTLSGSVSIPHWSGLYKMRNIAFLHTRLRRAAAKMQQRARALQRLSEPRISLRMKRRAKAFFDMKYRAAGFVRNQSGKGSGGIAPPIPETANASSIRQSANISGMGCDFDVPHAAKPASGAAAQGCNCTQNARHNAFPSRNGSF